MSERHEQEPNEYGLSFTFDGKEHILRPSNSHYEIFKDEPEFDHIYYKDKEEPYRLFRQVIDGFDEVIETMQEKGFNPSVHSRATPELRHMYYQAFGYPEIPRRELTEHEEKEVLFARYLLEHVIVTPEDFNV